MLTNEVVDILENVSEIEPDTHLKSAIIKKTSPRKNYSDELLLPPLVLSKPVEIIVVRFSFCAL